MRYIPDYTDPGDIVYDGFCYRSHMVNSLQIDGKESNIKTL